MNKPKLLELADFIENVDPKKFDMCLSKFNEDCGTSCCIAGYAVLKEGLCLKGWAVYDKDGHYLDNAETKALEILGLEENNRLFFVSDWGSEKLRDEYWEACNKDNRKLLPGIGAKAIRDFVANDGWE